MAKVKMAKDLKTFDKTKYHTEFVKDNYRRYEIRVRYDDKDVINHLNNVENRNQYILDLIKKDIKK